MARSSRQRYVRQMPKIYGNLQRPKRDWGGVFRMVRNSFWALAALSVVYAVLFSGFFSVKQVEVKGVRFAPVADLQTLVPRGKNIWLISRQQITANVMKYPSVESVSVQRGLPDHVRIVVQEKQPAMLWISGDNALVLDSAGTAFAQFSRSNLPDLGSVPRVYDAKAVPVKLGQQVAGSNFIQFITTAQDQMATLLPEVTIDHIEITETTYDVTFYAAQGLKVQMSSLSDAGVQVRNLTRLIHQKDANLNSSVDLRVDRWAYVK